MFNSDDTVKIELVISKIPDEQSKPFQTSLKHFQSLLDEDKLEEVIQKNVLPIYHALETLHKEKKIDSQEFKQRTSSLANIVQLVEDINANNILASKPYINPDVDIVKNLCEKMSFSDGDIHH